MHSESESSRTVEVVKVAFSCVFKFRDENLPEAEIMRSYRHPRVVSFLGVFKGFQMLEDRSLTKVRHASLCFLMHLADGSLGNQCSLLPFFHKTRFVSLWASSV